MKHVNEEGMKRKITISNHEEININIISISSGTHIK